MFSIRLGVPEMEALWAELSSKAKMGMLGKNEDKKSSGYEKIRLSATGQKEA